LGDVNISVRKSERERVPGVEINSVSSVILVNSQTIVTILGAND
jgi:hypothetical protein